MSKTLALPAILFLTGAARHVFSDDGMSATVWRIDFYIRGAEYGNNRSRRRRRKVHDPRVAADIYINLFEKGKKLGDICRAGKIRAIWAHLLQTPGFFLFTGTPEDDRVSLQFMFYAGYKLSVAFHGPSFEIGSLTGKRVDGKQ
jgi:hypothetical protein